MAGRTVALTTVKVRGPGEVGGSGRHVEGKRRAESAGKQVRDGKRDTLRSWRLYCSPGGSSLMGDGGGSPSVNFLGVLAGMIAVEEEQPVA